MVLSGRKPCLGGRASLIRPGDIGRPQVPHVPGTEARDHVTNRNTSDVHIVCEKEPGYIDNGSGVSTQRGTPPRPISGSAARGAISTGLLPPVGRPWTFISLRSAMSRRPSVSWPRLCDRIRQPGPRGSSTLTRHQLWPGQYPS